MTRKHRYLLSIVAVLTIFYMVFNAFYERMYGYFNLNDQLNSFLTFAQIFRWGLLAFVATGGFIAVHDQSKKVVPFYLIFFLFSLVIPAVFQ